ncbi:hypothetical protein HK100_011858 [Physocladia obscura]|uniref:Heterokaryon incompatibility domain-containing protein n=1 Tax=Physocladia obscura TaxID=109957 RepID=A0AAD5XGC1_9FUNG|nr:hypothetical protein HK100_011858 [Physocladia obscura]
MKLHHWIPKIFKKKRQADSGGSEEVNTIDNSDRSFYERIREDTTRIRYSLLEGFGILDVFKSPGSTQEPKTVKLVINGVSFIVVKDNSSAKGSVLTGVPSAAGNGEYDVISHVWGKVEKFKSRLVDKDLLVNSAAKLNAMETVIEQSRSRVWCDIFSIDQDDEKDKVAQVAVMDAIYEHASTCHILLDENDAQVLKKWAARFRESYLSVLVAALEIPMRGFGEVDEAILSDFKAKISLLVSAASVGGLSTVEYFQRAWTLQELLLSTKKKWYSFQQGRYTVIEEINGLGVLLSTVHVLPRLAFAFQSHNGVQATAVGVAQRLEVEELARISDSLVLLFSETSKRWGEATYRPLVVSLVKDLPRKASVQKDRVHAVYKMILAGASYDYSWSEETLCNRFERDMVAMGYASYGNGVQGRSWAQASNNDRLTKSWFDALFENKNPDSCRLSRSYAVVDKTGPALERSVLLVKGQCLGIPSAVKLDHSNASWLQQAFDGLKRETGSVFRVSRRIDAALYLLEVVSNGRNPGLRETIIKKATERLGGGYAKGEAEYMFKQSGGKEFTICSSVAEYLSAILKEVLSEKQVSGGAILMAAMAIVTSVCAMICRDEFIDGHMHDSVKPVSFYIGKYFGNISGTSMKWLRCHGETTEVSVLLCIAGEAELEDIGNCHLTVGADGIAYATDVMTAAGDCSINHCVYAGKSVHSGKNVSLVMLDFPEGFAVTSIYVS